MLCMERFIKLYRGSKEALPMDDPRFFDTEQGYTFKKPTFEGEYLTYADAIPVADFKPLCQLARFLACGKMTVALTHYLVYRVGHPDELAQAFNQMEWWKVAKNRAEIWKETKEKYPYLKDHISNKPF